MKKNRRHCSNFLGKDADLTVARFLYQPAGHESEPPKPVDRLDDGWEARVLTEWEKGGGGGRLRERWY